MIKQTTTEKSVLTDWSYNSNEYLKKKKILFFLKVNDFIYHLNFGIPNCL